MFDYFDGGVMEILQHRLVQTGTMASNCGGSIVFTGRPMARRVNSGGIIEHLIQWSPKDM